MWQRNTRMSLTAFVLLLCIHFSSTSSYNGGYGRLIYLEFTSNSVSALPPVSAKQTYLLATRSDDSPFTRVKLPFSFNYFGNKIYNIFVNPNGAIHQTYDQPCDCACFGGTAKCSFSQTYFGLIAGYLADLNPSQAPLTANITSYITSDMVSIIYKAVPFFARKDAMTFRISIFNDSHVNIDYDLIYIAQNHSLWLTGMRPPLYNHHTNFTKTQIATGINDWNSTFAGLYPPKANVKSGSSYTICPFSRVWGAKPGRLNVAATTGSHVILTLIALQASCQSLVDIVFYLNAASTLLSTSIDLAPCIAQTGASSSLQCNITSLSYYERVAGAVNGLLAWRVRGSGSSYTKMLIDPIPITFYKSTPAGSGQCSLNTPTTGYNCLTDQLCTGNYTCLRLPCDNGHALLFKNPTCGNISAATDTNICSIDLAYNRATNQCCTIEQQDCTGKCFGKTLVGFAGVASKTLVCCVGRTVDCTGVCGGTIVRDACGVCGGKDKLGLECNVKVAIQTGFGYNALFAKIDYAQPSKLWSLGHINITNQNSSELLVNITVQGHFDSSPLITVGSLIGNTVIPPYSSRSYPINVSLASLYNGVLTDWQVKIVQVTYYRLSVSSFQYSYPVSIYPGAHNCSAITSASACMRIPACIFCAAYPSLRILRENGDEDNEGNNGGYGGHEKYEVNRYIGDEGDGEYGGGRMGGIDEDGDITGTAAERYYTMRQQGNQRKLFTGLVPPQLGDGGYPFIEGVCTDGFLTSNCVPYSSGSTLKSSFFTAFIAVFILFIINIYL